MPIGFRGAWGTATGGGGRRSVSWFTLGRQRLAAHGIARTGRPREAMEVRALHVIGASNYYLSPG